MKVSALIEKLQGLDQSLEVLCYTEEAAFVRDGAGFRLLDIEAVSTTQAQSVRLDDGTPYLKLGKTETSSEQVLLEVTSDF